MKKYPDVSQILAKKALGRKALERLPVQEKIRISSTLSKAAVHAHRNARMINKQVASKNSSRKTTKVA
jgi:hypothetical protein